MRRIVPTEDIAYGGKPIMTIDIPSSIGTSHFSENRKFECLGKNCSGCMSLNSLREVQE